MEEKEYITKVKLVIEKEKKTMVALMEAKAWPLHSEATKKYYGKEYIELTFRREV